VSKVEKYFNSYDMRDELVSVHQIMAELKGKSQNQMTVAKAYEFHITKLEKLVGVDYVAETVKRYKSSLNDLIFGTIDAILFHFA
jgi:hypothetical protein